MDSSSYYAQNPTVLADSGSLIPLNNDSVYSTGNSGHGVDSYGAKPTMDNIAYPPIINMTADTIVILGNGV